MTSSAGPDDLAGSQEFDLDKWGQGDILDLSEYFHASKRSETTPGEDADGFLLKVIRSNVDAVMITTQTCDVVRPLELRPYIEVCPVVKSVDQNLIAQALEGKSIHFAATPWYGADTLADLERSMTLDKAILGSVKKVSSSPTKDELKILQATVARRYSRFAFPDDFSDAMSRFRKKFASKHGKNTPEGELLRSVSQVRVAADPSWEAKEYEVTFYFLVSRSVLPTLPESLAESAALTDAKTWMAIKNRSSSDVASYMGQVSDAQARNYLWRILAEKWMELIDFDDRFVDAYAEVSPEDEFVMRDYWNTEALDFDYLSGPREGQGFIEHSSRDGVRASLHGSGHRRFRWLNSILRRFDT